MATLVNAETGQLEDVPDDVVSQAVQSQAYGLPEELLQDDSTVAVYDRDGQRGTIPIGALSDAMASGYRLGSLDDAKEIRANRKYGESEGLAALAGAARGLTFGLSDAALVKSGAVGAETLEGLRTANPAASMIGEVGAEAASMLIPGGAIVKGAGAAGAAARGAQLAARAVGAPSRAVSALAEAAGKKAVSAALSGGAESAARAAVGKLGATAVQGTLEGAVYGAGTAVSDAALQNRALTVEALAGGAGMGALLGGGMGAGVGGASILGAAAVKGARKAVDSALGKGGIAKALEDLAEESALKGVTDARGTDIRRLRSEKNVHEIGRELLDFRFRGSTDDTKGLAGQALFKAGDKVDDVRPRLEAAEAEVGKELGDFRSVVDQYSRESGREIDLRGLWQKIEADHIAPLRNSSQPELAAKAQKIEGAFKWLRDAAVGHDEAVASWTASRAAAEEAASATTAGVERAQARIASLQRELDDAMGAEGAKRSRVYAARKSDLEAATRQISEIEDEIRGVTSKKARAEASRDLKREIESIESAPKARQARKVSELQAKADELDAAIADARASSSEVLQASAQPARKRLDQIQKELSDIHAGSVAGDAKALQAERRAIERELRALESRGAATSAASLVRLQRERASVLRRIEKESTAKAALSQSEQRRIEILRRETERKLKGEIEPKRVGRLRDRLSSLSARRQKLEMSLADLAEGAKGGWSPDAARLRSELARAQREREKLASLGRKHADEVARLANQPPPAPPKMSLADMTKARMELDKVLYPPKQKGQGLSIRPEWAGELEQARGALEDFISKQTDDLVSEMAAARGGLGGLDSRYRALKAKYRAVASAKKIAQKSEQQNLGNRWVSLTDNMGAGVAGVAGAVTGSGPLALAAWGLGAIGHKLMRERMRTVLARFADKAAKSQVLAAKTSGVTTRIEKASKRIVEASRGSRFAQNPSASATSVLSRFAATLDPTGRRTKPKDQREAAKVAAEKVVQLVADKERLAGRMAAMTAELGDLDGDLADALAMQTVAALEHLAATAPRPLVADPLQPTLDAWLPTEAEAAGWARRVRAAEDPLSLLDDLEAGRLSADAVDTVHAVYPEMVAQMAASIAEAVSGKDTRIPYARRAQIGLLLGAPTTLMADADVFALMHQGPQQAQQAQQDAPPKRKEATSASIRQVKADERSASVATSMLQPV